MPTFRLLASVATVAAAATVAAGVVAGEPRALPVAAVLALLGLAAWSRPFGSRGGHAHRQRRARSDGVDTGGSSRGDRDLGADADGRGDASSAGLGDAEAYRLLDLEPGASQAEVRRAYLQKVKAVHPDRGGDEAAFKRVTAAYDRLRG